MDKENIPRHISVIMDGNGRWAKEQGKPRVFGHRNGVRAVREITEACAEVGVKYLTLYAFSTENWGRPRFEINALMGLLVDTLKAEIETLNKNNIRLEAIGDLEGLPKKTYRALLDGIRATASNDHMTLILALNYSSRWDMTNAVRRISEKIENGRLTHQDISAETISNNLSTADCPDPELIIRSSGEQRLSNFLLWESAYSEFYFTPVYWPDFTKAHLHEAIESYQNRQRRFGKI